MRIFGSSVEPGLAGHNDQGIGQVGVVAGGPYLLRIGGIDDAQLGKVLLLAKGEAQHLGAEAGAAHAEQQNRLEVGRLHLRAQRGIGGQILLLALDDVEPAQPFLLAVVGPQGWVLLPEAGNLVVGAPVGGGPVHGAAKFGWQCELDTHVVIHCASSGRITESRTLVQRKMSLEQGVDSNAR